MNYKYFQPQKENARLYETMGLTPGKNAAIQEFRYRGKKDPRWPRERWTFETGAKYNEVAFYARKRS
jgi:hypothetical protein